MDKEEFKHKRDMTGNAFSGHGLYSGRAGSKTKAGVRGVYYYDGRLEDNVMYGGGNEIKYNLREPFDPMVRTCKENKRLVN